MKNLILFFVLPFCLIACDVSGVNADEQEVDDSTHDSISELRNLNDTINDNVLLVDTIDGHANEMVYQSKNGLRVEWSNKTQNPKVGPDNVALVNYKVRVAGGEEYDNNDKIGYPVPLKSGIGMMVEGWEIGLQEMAKGDEGRIMIPNALAYGEDGYSTIVPPNADLIVDIEIVDIVKPIKLKEGVKVYKWKEEVDAKKPVKNQEITFDYFAYYKGEGAHMYDNSFQNQEPFSFKFKNSNVMEGLQQGMAVMKAGENAFIDIPAKLAYGKKGLLDFVPANRDVVYDVRVISIEDE